MRFGRRCLAAAAAGVSAPARRTNFAPRYLFSRVLLAPFLVPYRSDAIPLSFAVVTGTFRLPLLRQAARSLAPLYRALSFPPLVSHRSCSRSPALCSPSPSAGSPVTSSSRRQCGGASSRLYVAANPAMHTTPLFEPSRRLLSPDTHAEMCFARHRRRYHHHRRRHCLSTTTTTAVAAAADSQRCPRRRPRRLC